jgi:hypothetical protein
MSALGHKRTFALQKAMSALLLKADVCGANRHVCYGPIADIRHDLSNLTSVFRCEHVRIEIGNPLLTFLRDAQIA